MEHAANDWFLDETFWATVYPFMFPDTSYAAAAEQVGHLLALTGLTAGTVLDLACGPGRYTIPLAQRGFRVTGVDCTPLLLDKARTYAAAAHVQVEWVQDDMRWFTRTDAFDLVVNLFTSFGYFETSQENRTVVQNVHASLKRGGVFVLDVLGKEVLARIFQPTSAQELPGVGLLIQRRQVIEDWSRINNEWLLIQAGAVRTFLLYHWLYAGVELKELLLSSGFATVQLYGNFEGAAYGPGATRLIAVARKSGK
jgi:SAM-dependent methyltransferase